MLFVTNRREEMMAAAYEIVSEEGIEGLHARSIAARIGVNHAAVHYYFPKRQDLLLGLSEFCHQKFTADRSTLIENANGDRLKAHFRQVRAYCRPDSGFLTVWSSLFVASTQDLTLRAELVRHLREWAFTLKLDLKGTRAGNPLADPETLVAMLQGLMLSAQVLGEEFDFRSKLKVILRSLE